LVSAAIDRRLLALGEILSDGRPKSRIESLCIERQIADLRTGHERGLCWDENEAQRAVTFFGALKHWKGAKAGQRFRPEPWQEHLVIAPTFGWYRERSCADGGRRRFTTAYFENPRKTGKTFLASGFLSQGLIADRESGADVFSAATTREQAMLLFKDVKNSLSGPLKDLVQVFKFSIHCPYTQSTLTPLSSDHNSLDGLNIHRAVVDELHAHKTRDLWDVLATATGARANPMIVAITTAGHDRSSICWEQRESIRKIVDGQKHNDAYMGFITCAEETDDWKDPMTWWKANPNLGVSFYRENVEDLCRHASDNPGAENAFRRLYLNQWTQQSVRWIPMNEWDECGGDVDIESLRGAECYAGLDLASTRDVNALVLVFRVDGKYAVIPYFWVPEQAKDERGRQDRTQVVNWASKTDEDGRPYIKRTPGNTTDYSVIVDDIMDLSRQFEIRELAYDAWGPASAFVQMLQGAGFDSDRLYDFRQSHGNYNMPCQELYRAVMSRRLMHGGHPVLRWMASNVAVNQNTSGYIRPDKAKSDDKIDGIAALLMGLGRSLLHKRNDVYEYVAGSLLG
jgi:phage terminase large subunit-like protein